MQEVDTHDTYAHRERFQRGKPKSLAHRLGTLMSLLLLFIPDLSLTLGLSQPKRAYHISQLLARTPPIIVCWSRNSSMCPHLSDILNPGSSLWLSIPFKNAENAVVIVNT